MLAFALVVASCGEGTSRLEVGDIQEYLGRAAAKTTAIYLPGIPRADAAARRTAAFAMEEIEEEEIEAA